MPRKRILPIEEQQAFLARAKEWHRECIAMMTRAPIGEPFYMAMESMTDAIDGVAEAVTGERRALRPPQHSIGKG